MTDCAKCITNRGKVSRLPEWSSGAWKWGRSPRVIQVLQTPETDETLRVGLTGVSVDGARQYRPRLRVYRVVPKHNAGTKAATGLSISIVTYKRRAGFG